MTELVCIECGQQVRALFKKYEGGSVKLSHCSGCQSLADKYVEYDWVLVSLDALLHKTQAYRHIIYNSQIQSHAKLATLFLVFDAYSKWTQLKYHSDAGQRELVIFYAAMEISFYKMVFLSLCEMVSSFSVLFVSLFLLRNTGFNSNNKSSLFIVKGLTLSNLGKVFLVPAVIWARHDAALYLGLIRLLQFTSNAQALRVLTQMRVWLAASLSALMFLAELGCRNAVTELLDR